MQYVGIIAMLECGSVRAGILVNCWCSSLQDRYGFLSFVIPYLHYSLKEITTGQFLEVGLEDDKIHFLKGLGGGGGFKLF